MRQTDVNDRIDAEQVPLRPRKVPANASAGLSIRAANVLKLLASELTGETPPKGEWIPSDHLLRQLTAEHLAAARNCGPQTAREIVDWARSRGVVVPVPLYAGKSLSQVWASLIARATARKLTRAEIAEALQKSIRRKSARIPVACQIVLLEILSSGYDQPLP